VKKQESPDSVCCFKFSDYLHGSEHDFRQMERARLKMKVIEFLNDN